MTGRALRSLLRCSVLGVAIAAAACQSPQRAPEPAGQAVVVYARERMADANMIGDRLSALGFDVELQVEGPLSRARSSAAVYGLRTDESRLGRVRDAVAPLDDIELLPFAQPGPGDTDVVVWLIAPGAPGGDETTPPEEDPDADPDAGGASGDAD